MKILCARRGGVRVYLIHPVPSVVAQFREREDNLNLQILCLLK